ncbi:MAG: pirin family protein [Thermoplasmata archaeon]
MPARMKMSDPSYRSMKGTKIPVVEDDRGNRIKIISGRYHNVYGSLNEYFDYSPASLIDPYYLDIEINEESDFETDIPSGYTGIIFVISGRPVYSDTIMKEGNAYVFAEDGSHIKLSSVGPSHILLLGGKPLNEPVAWYGPVVMNSREEIEEAIEQLRTDKFVKNKNPVWQ